MSRLIRSALLIGLVAGCSAEEEPTTTTQDTPVAPDVTDAGDEEVAAPETTDSADTGEGDSRVEPPAPTLREPPAFPALPDLCSNPEPEPKVWPMDADKLSLAIYHFNIQYVAGGLDNYLGVWTASDEEIQDLIVVESFEPLVDLFERHPDWGASFEMQGLMIEVMAERHPEILERFHRLVRRGQVDLMTYHWSDQLVTAYPRQDMVWSWAENQQLLEALCLPRAPVHFLQEGQFGPGIAQFADDMGGEVVILPRNLLKQFHEPAPQGLVHSNRGLRTVVTNGHNTPNLSLNWSFVDDGELLATGDLNPYLVSEFEHRPEAVAAYEAKLQALEDDGWTIAPVSHYLKVLDAEQVEPTVIDPPVLDGSWQPSSSDNMRIWMGWFGQFPGAERDNEILTTNVELRQRLTAIEWLLGEAEAEGVDLTTARPLFRHAVRRLLLAEVSDSTGWRPTGTEIAYSLEFQAEVTELTDELGAWLLWQLGHRQPRRVDPVEGTIGDLPEVEPPAPLPAPPEGLEGVTATSDRPVETTWYDYGTYVEYVVSFAAGKELSPNGHPPPVEVEVPLPSPNVWYSPAVAETELIEVPIDAYAFAQSGDRMGLPLPNGLLGLGDWTLVLDQRTVHVAASLAPDRVTFEDEVSPSHLEAVWVIRFYPEPAADVLERANRLNVNPPVFFSVPAE